MAKFFTTPIDLMNWVKTQNHTASEAADKLYAVIGSADHAQDIAESTRRIFAGAHPDHAADVLFKILSSYDITEATVKTACQKVGEVYAANELLKNKMITADQHGKMVKEAQMIREPGQMSFGMRVCPKLPMSVASRRVSQYTCVHYCTASMVLDEEPERVYCMESLWRKHVMDKFSRDIQDPKTGKMVGGYINNRFFKFPTAGTPANPDAPVDGGNPMKLLPGERSRQPQPHEWSIERRMQEQREKNSTESITLASSKEMIKTAGFQNALMKQAEAVGFIKLTASEVANPVNENVSSVFSEAVELHASGISPEDASVRLAQSHKMKVEEIVKIQEFAIKKLAQHQADVYLLEKVAGGMNEPSALGASQNAQSIAIDQQIVDAHNRVYPANSVWTPTGKPNEFAVRTPNDAPNAPVQTTTLNSEDANHINSTIQSISEVGLNEPVNPNKANQNPQQQPVEQASVPTPTPEAATEGVGAASTDGVM